MRMLPACPAVLVATLVTPVAGPIAAQDIVVDTYWQRESGTKFFAELKPFRNPNSRVLDDQRSQLVDLVHDFVAMMDIAADAKKEELSIDELGREVCADKQWSAAHERIKANGLRMEGWVGKVILEDGDARRRRACAYGMFYFNDPQNVFHLISYLPGEPIREIREDGYQRALSYLRAHLPENKPQNPKFPDNGVVVPKFAFNPLPFMQLLDAKDPVDQAQGLWFLTEILQIRPDLGKAYLDEVAPRLRELLDSDSPMMVHDGCVSFLAAIDPKRGRAAMGTRKEERIKWLDQLLYELFPPIRHVSSGRVELYPSEDLDQVVTVGKRLLAVEDLLPKGTAKPKGGSTRYGIRINRLPKPLDMLGLPLGSLIVGLNAAPTRNVEELKTRIEELLAEHEKEKIAYEKYQRQWRPKDKDDAIRPPRITVFQVEYIYQDKTQMKEYVLRL